ncbi:MULTISPECIES: LuxR C-terminal-related transcriptional regulator [Prauserella salsuginis group]|uniref:LuxR C-terminal-related transcriptional regulator n=1 Tax=Prauserella salsuginis TaxID=387889 RepID=A0ABW6G3W2_9PSEU|nr:MULTISPECIES: LuxR C-terminal-related transcriptional regulator [Prauserella salsuginis group]MCR3718360.1 LuxR family transcriptional regulator, maltose regulon positive regulatory protein [Prauserella flava]MCR3732930.1 LuxR family transcriptional regulator, maltose regulon positive regulatory protein [Prauserella salsuginis]
MEHDVPRRSRVPRLKTAVPALAPNLVTRERLSAVLDRAPSAGVVWVCAPAGTGKTTLLTQWCGGRAGATPVWVSLDADDNDEPRFWSALLQAVENGVPSVRERPVSVPAHPSEDPEFLATIAETLGSVAGGAVLVLDDVHELTNQATLHGLAGVLRGLPRTARVVLSGRAVPGAPLTRKGLGVSVTEVSAEQLRFTAGEAAHLLAEAQPDAPPGTLPELMRRTEGWAAGLRHAALELRAHAGDGRDMAAPAAVRALPAAGHIADEVLSAMGERDRQLVAALGVCDEVSPELAAALSGRPDTEARLAALERGSVVARRQVPGGTRYRLRAPFREHARAVLYRRDPERAARLAGVAAEWYAAGAEPAAALAHACASRQSGTIRAVLRRCAIPAVLAGEHDLVRRALAALPAETAAGDGLLALVAAFVRVEAGEAELAELDLVRADALVRYRAGTETDTLRRLVGARIRRITGQPDDGGDNGDAARVVPSSPLEAMVQLHRADLLLCRDRPGEAGELADSALRAARAGRADYVVARCLTTLSGVAALRGDFRSMTELASNAAAADAEGPWEAGTAAAEAHLLLGYGALLRAELRCCLQHVDEVLRLLDRHRTGAHGTRLVATTLRGAAESERGERTRGLHRVCSARDAADTGRAPGIAVLLCGFLEHRLALDLHRPDVAVRARERCHEVAPGSGEIAVMRAREQLASGRHGPAARVLRPALTERLPMALPWSTVCAVLADAEIQQLAGRSREAERALVRAMEHAQSQNVLYPLVVAPPLIGDVLETGLGRFGACEPLARRVAAARRGLPQLAPLTLTERERAVLGLLPTALSLEEIADDLTVSLNTVKTHTRAIYLKLGVTKRADAVGVARAHGLLDDVHLTVAG